MRSLLLIFALIIATAAPAPTFADDLAPVTASCRAGCYEGDSDKAFCNRYCDCTTAELGRYKGKERQEVLQSQVKVEAIAGICLGREMSSLFSGSVCNEDCAGDESCKKKCSCMGEKIAGLGGENERAKFFTGFVQDDAAVNKQMNDWKAACEAG